MSEQKLESEQKSNISITPVYRGVIDFEYKPTYTGNIEKDINILLETILKVTKNTISDYYKNSVTKAVCLVHELFKDDRRGDGTMFYTHFLEAAHIILKKFKFYDLNTILAAILHDSIEDKPDQINLEFIRKEFNDEVADIVDGVTKITSNDEIEQLFRYSIDREISYDDIEIATIKKLFQYGLKNPKIFFVKLADRYHNILTLYGIKRPQRRKEIALQTINVYLPIVKLLEYDDIYRELRDFCLFHIIADNLEDAKLQYQKLKEYHQKAHQYFLNLLVDYKVEEKLKKIFEKISEKILFYPAHKGLFDLYQALSQNDWTLPETYPYFYLIIDIPLGIFDNEFSTLIDNIFATNFGIIDKIILNQYSQSTKYYLQEQPLTRYILSLNNSKVLEVVIKLSSPSISSKVNIETIVRKENLKYYYDQLEYQAFLEMIDELLTSNPINKMEQLLYYSRRILRTDNIPIKVINKDISNFVPRGWTILDVAFREFENNVLKLIAAKVRNPNKVEEGTQKLDYVLQPFDEIEFFFSKENQLTPKELDSLMPFSLHAINSIRKLLKNAKKENIEDNQMYRFVKYVGIDEVGALNKVTDLSNKYLINLEDNFARKIIDNSFHGSFAANFRDLKKLNLFLIELASLKQINEIEVFPENSSFVNT